MKIFITGGTGYVGYHIVETLLQHGHSVRVLTHSNRIPQSWEQRGVEKAQGDVGEIDTLRGRLNGCDAIIHLVGILFEKGKNTFERAHHQGTQNMLLAAGEAGIHRFIHMSALGTRSDAQSEYHKTKYKAEEAVRSASVTHTIFRPSFIIGPGDHISPPLMTSIRYAPVLFIPNPPQARFQPISVHDVADCFVNSLQNEQSHNETFELGGPLDYSMPEMVGVYMKLMGKKRLVVPFPPALLKLPVKLLEKIPGVPVNQDQLIMLQEGNTCSTARSQEVFGVPKRNLETMIRELLNENSK